MKETIRRARLRIWRNEALRRLGIAGAAASILLLALLGMDGTGLLSGWIIWGGPAAVLVAGVLHAARTSVSREEAAIFLDRRLGDGDLLSSALTAPSGRLGRILQEEAGARCETGDLIGLLPYRPGRLARSVPVILLLCLSVRIASGGGPEGNPEVPSSPSGGAAIAVEMEAREIIDEVRSGQAVRADLPDRLREIAEDLGETLSLYAEVEEALRDADPEDREKIEDLLSRAASRLPEGSEAQHAAARGSVAALEDALRGGETRSLEEALLEVRRIGRQKGMDISSGPGGRLPPVAEGLDTAMDREDVPWRYRETVRRYFDKKGESRR